MGGDAVERPRLGLALGGGGARGLAHIGVLEVLEEAGLRPDLVAGVSFGALVGVLYAHLGSASEVRERIAGVLRGEGYRASRLRQLGGHAGPRFEGALSSVVRAAVRGGPFREAIMEGEGFLAAGEMGALLGGVVPDVSLEETAIPFFTVATELLSGEEVVLEEGEARRAVMASSAMPGVMPPVPWKGKLLADGGCVCKVPARHMRERGADVVLYSDVSTWVALEPGTGLSGLDALLRSREILDRAFRRLQMEECDVVLRVPVEDVHWALFERLEHCIEQGRREAARHLPALREALARAGRRGPGRGAATP